MLMHTVPIETAEGQWSITSWRIKSKAELLRLKGSTVATSYQDQVREEVQQKKIAKLAELEPQGKYARFMDARTGKQVTDLEGN